MMEFFKTADVVVIGGGIVGTAILRELSKYDLKCVLVEKEPDLAAGTTKANSAILHAGFDAPTGSLKAVTNVRGNKLYHELQKNSVWILNGQVLLLLLPVKKKCRLYRNYWNAVRKTALKACVF